MRVLQHELDSLIILLLFEIFVEIKLSSLFWMGKLFCSSYQTDLPAAI